MRDGEPGRGQRLLYIVLVPAIVLAVAILGWLALRTTLRIEQARQRTVLDVTATLATERVDALDNFIIAQDNVVGSIADLTDLTNLPRRWLATAARETPSVRAIVVFDLTYETHEVVAYASKAPSPADDEFRRLLLSRLYQDMNLVGTTEELRHLHDVVDEAQYLVSYWQRVSGRRRYMVVVWHDVARLVRETMPSLYRDPERGNVRMNVTDERGRIVYGRPIRAGQFTVGRNFPTTLYNWNLQLALESAAELTEQVERKRLLEMAAVTMAALVAMFGLFVIIRTNLKDHRLNVLKSDFVANVSHELKTPLSLIRMFGELLLTERVRDATRKREYYQIILSESERLTALIENVLDFARVERGKVAYDRVPSDVSEIAARAVEIHRYRAEREGARIDLEVEEDLPFCDIDVRAVELAIMNLVDNAIKYAKEGGVVKLVVARQGAYVAVRVVDRGPGIPKAEQGRVFERFFRGKSAGASQARGSGIGLSLVAHIAKSHGGKILVESPVENGSGTAFTLLLPRSKHPRPPELDMRPSTPAPRPRAGEPEPPPEGDLGPGD